ncbi:MAG TPA: hypothetical protein VHT91_31325 [Kofleriaceae bacterium]|nr:hypothetical protein [Kofleriaceae bacterium]
MTVADVRAALALARPHHALVTLRRMADAAEQGGSETLAEWLELLERAVGALAGPTFAAAVRSVRQAPDDAAALERLGRRLISEGWPQIAVTLLGRAHRIDPLDPRVLAALVSALAADGQHARACAVLRDAPAPGVWGLGRRGVLARHALLSGDLDAARHCMPSLLASTDPAHQELALEIGGMLARADAVARVSPLDDHDLRGWHFVVTGGLLLHRSPDDEPGMNGRYAFVHDRSADCLEGLCRAAAVLAALHRPVDRILAPADRASAILARAAALRLDCPVVDWPAGDIAAPGLIVAYSADELASDARRAVHDHRPGQVLHCHAASWTREPPFAPDLVTRLHQYYRAPWDGHSGVDPHTGEPVHVPPDAADLATLAARIAEAPRDPPDADLDALLALADAARAVAADAAAGALRDRGTRRRAWCGSPVPSQRFE